MDFPVIGIGASAGGLKPLETFFDHLPAGPGMAFVILQHAHPGHRSLLPDLVAQHTTLPVVEVEDGMVASVNTVYLPPAGRYIGLEGGHLHLLEIATPKMPPTPIDYLFRSLAREAGPMAAGVLLSGSGSDGTVGLAAIKEGGGVTAVQDPSTAEYDSMPRSPIRAGVADWVLPVEEIPSRLQALMRAPRPRLPATQDDTPQASALRKVLMLLRSRTGHDFSLYKENTIRRRMERRMALHGLTDLADYLVQLQKEPSELDRLSRELMIGVTSFFRDPEAFQSLGEQVIPNLVSETRAPDDTLRIWVPGCSTGEEAYSIAILVLERLQEVGSQRKVVIFASDIDAESIAKAREGTYPEGIALDVSPERLANFFEKIGNTYRVRQNVRDTLIFAEQSLVNDPPFSKLDLISCRNLLIYMQPELQQRVIGLFTYALKPGGYLFLGSSESLSSESNAFTILDKRWRIFYKSGLPQAGGYQVPVLRLHSKTIAWPPEQPGPEAPRDLRRVVERILLDRHCPTAVVIDSRGQVLYIHGRSSAYLEPPQGRASLDLLSMAREELKLSLASVITQAAKTGQPATGSTVVPVVREEGPVLVDMEVVSMAPEVPALMLVLFRSRPVPTGPPEDSTPATEDGSRVLELENELTATREYLRTTIEELQTSNEELKSSNEELQSSNEELQSTNEELETSKEELQSLNEELTTVNAEFRAKNEELVKTANDMTNLLSSTEIAMIFVGNDLSIVRFTPSATQVSRLILTDVGRPLGDIATRLDYDQTRLVEDVREVLRTLASRELDVCAHDGRHYAVRIMPYRTAENVIDGAVLTFVDITLQRRLQQQMEGPYLAAERCPEPILVCDPDGTVEYANPGCQAQVGQTAPFLEFGGSRMWEQLRAGRAWDHAFYRQEAGGALRRHVLSVMPVSGSDGKLAHLAAFEHGVEEPALFEVACGVLLELDLQARVRRANQQACQVLGQPQGAILGCDWLQSFVPDAAREQARVFFQGEGAYPDGWEGPLITDKGEQRFVWTRAPLQDVAGNSIGCVCCGQNVTRERLAERLLSRTRGLLGLMGLLERRGAKDPHAAEHDLLSQVCRGLVERVGYSGAWAGFADWKVPQRLEQVFQAGQPDDGGQVYPVLMKMLGRGGGSDRILRPVTHADPGKGASLTLALSTDTDLLGVLHLTDTDPIAFGPDEVELLSCYADALTEALRDLRRKAGAGSDGASEKS